MSNILDDYREWAAAQPTRVITHNDRCHLYHTDCMVHRLARRLEEAELTDEEREAVEVVLRMCGDPSPATAPLVLKYATTLRAQLERAQLEWTEDGGK